MSPLWFHVAPFGALCFVYSCNHGFTPVATTCCPSRTERTYARGFDAMEANEKQVLNNPSLPVSIRGNIATKFQEEPF